MLPLIRSNDRKAMARLFAARQSREAEAEKIARRIIQAVCRDGDRALVRLSRKLDRTDLARTGFTVPEKDVERARREMGREFINAVEQAAKNIRATAQRQLPPTWTIRTGAGVKVGQIIRPLDRVACYVPGGRFPLPSTVLMSVIPAQVAGVREIFITSPRPSAAVLATAGLLGIRKIFRLGGAQAVAAFAFGTESVPRVDKIVGPGNRFVAAAKKLLAGTCGIDFVAGPTELVIVGSGGRPEWIAADLAAQAEHDPDASAILVTPSMELARRVQKSVSRILAELQLPLAETALSSSGGVIVTRSLDEAVEWASRLAPEHVALLDDAIGHLVHVQSAGAIFLGGYSPVAAGDYAAGGNHVLPTGGAARVRGGLSAADFVKTISVQHLSRAGLSGLRRTV
ncbi:MAG: histidinol dehydrogenase, partial [Terracidiphilus sp.]